MKFSHGDKNIFLRGKTSTKLPWQQRHFYLLCLLNVGIENLLCCPNLNVEENLRTFVAKVLPVLDCWMVVAHEAHACWFDFRLLSPCCSIILLSRDLHDFGFDAIFCHIPCTGSFCKYHIGSQLVFGHIHHTCHPRTMNAALDSHVADGCFLQK